MLFCTTKNYSNSISKAYLYFTRQHRVLKSKVRVLSKSLVGAFVWVIENIKLFWYALAHATNATDTNIVICKFIKWQGYTYSVGFCIKILLCKLACKIRILIAEMCEAQPCHIYILWHHNKVPAFAEAQNNFIFSIVSYA